MSIIIVLALLVILAALAAAGFFMLRSGGNTGDAAVDDQEAQARNSRMAKALAVRIAVSVVLFICILIAWKMGYIKPAGIPIGK